MIHWPPILLQGKSGHLTIIKDKDCAKLKDINKILQKAKYCKPVKRWGGRKEDGGRGGICC